MAVFLPAPPTALPVAASDVSDDGDGDDDDVFDDGALCPVQGPRSSLHPTSGYYSATRPPRRLLLATVPALPIALNNFSTGRSTLYLKLVVKIISIHRDLYLGWLATDSPLSHGYIVRLVVKRYLYTIRLHLPSN